MGKLNYIILNIRVGLPLVGLLQLPKPDDDHFHDQWPDSFSLC